MASHLDVAVHDEELLFAGLLSGLPVSDCGGLLGAVRNVDERGVRMQTPLHVTVRLGKFDWVERLVESGADPSLRDSDGYSVVQVAEKICNKHPGDTDLHLIFQIVRIVDKFASARRAASAKSNGIAIGDIVAPIPTSSVLGNFGHSMPLGAEESPSMEVPDHEKQANEKGHRESLRKQGSAILVYHGFTPEEKDRWQCAEAVMSMIQVTDNCERKTSLVLGLLHRLYSTSPLTSCILIFLKSQTHASFVVGSDCIWINAKHSFNDGVKMDDESSFTLPGYEEGMLYLNGRVDADLRENYLAGFLAMALSNMAMQFAFTNGGRPFSKEDEIHKKQYKTVMNGAREVWRMMEEKLDFPIPSALSNKNKRISETHLIMAVPFIVSFYGSSEGPSRLRSQLPLLIQYYEEHVVGTLLDKSKL